MIKFTNVTKSYQKDHAVLDGLNLTINDGEFVFIIGESGAGKTTMMKLLLREEKPDSGKLIVGDTDLTRISSFKVPKRRQRAAISPAPVWDTDSSSWRTVWCTRSIWGFWGRAEIFALVVMRLPR